MVDYIIAGTNLINQNLQKVMKIFTKTQIISKDRKQNSMGIKIDSNVNLMIKTQSLLKIQTPALALKKMKLAAACVHFLNEVKLAI